MIGNCIRGWHGWALPRAPQKPVPAMDFLLIHALTCLWRGTRISAHCLDRPLVILGRGQCRPLVHQAPASSVCMWAGEGACLLSLGNRMVKYMWTVGRFIRAIHVLLLCFKITLNFTVVNYIESKGGILGRFEMRDLGSNTCSSPWSSSGAIQSLKWVMWR